MICDTCGLPDEICVCETIAREQQDITITVDSRRYGKKMTVVSGINDGHIDIDKLLSNLKSKCACGGTLKDGNIELQGDHSRKVQGVLGDMGFTAQIDMRV